MAKLISRKSKSFTLLELLISVSIFIVVVVIVMSTLSITISSKSKIQASNKLRTEGGKVMAEIQYMVEEGNTTVSGTPNYYGAYFPNSTELYSVYTNSKGDKITRGIKFNSTKIEKYEQIAISGGTTTTQDWTSILPAEMEIDTSKTNSFSGTNRSGTSAARIVAQFTLIGKTTGYVGQVPTITLNSTFTSHYPYPDKAGDSL